MMASKGLHMEGRILRIQDSRETPKKFIIQTRW